jgi:hypothetical protein
MLRHESQSVSVFTRLNIRAIGSRAEERRSAEVMWRWNCAALRAFCKNSWEKWRRKKKSRKINEPFKKLIFESVENFSSFQRVKSDK